MKRILCVFGTRSELLALAPALRALARRGERIRSLQAAASEEGERLRRAAGELGIRVDRGLPDVADAAAPAAAARLLEALGPLFEAESPDLLLLHGGSLAAVAGAVTARLRGVPVAQLAYAAVRGGASEPETALARRELVARLAALHLEAAPGGAAAADPGERLAGELECFLAAPAGARPARALAHFVAEARQRVDEISPEEARRILQAPGREGWEFLDVREPEEYAAGHLPGARNVPRGFLEVRADLAHYKRDPWLADRERRLILYCGGGHRSALAAQTLQQMGFARVVSLAEGFSGWTARDFPQER